MRPKRRHYDFQDPTSSMRTTMRTRASNMETGTAGPSTTTRPHMNPLILLAYAQKFRQQQQEQQNPDMARY